MRGRLLIWVASVFIVLVGLGQILAQTNSDQPREPPSLLERLDNFGRRVFGGERNRERSTERERPLRPSLSRPIDDPPSTQPPERRDVPKQAIPNDTQSVRKDRQPAADVSALDGEPHRLMTSPPTEEVTVTDEKAPTRDLPPVPGVVPLHQRLSEMRNSPFGKAPPGGSDREGGTKAAAAEGDRPASLPTSVKPDAAAPSMPTLAAPREADVPTAIPTVSAGPPTLSAGPPTLSAGPPTVSAGQKPRRSSADTPGPASAGSGAFATQSPALSVETAGPRRIAIGKEGVYEVVVRNRGGAAAEQVLVSVDLPEWAEVAGVTATSGTTGFGKSADRAGPMRWQLARLEAQGQERLTLKIVPRQSRPFELLAKCEYVPPPARATVEVEEARLVMALQGPREVLFGKAEAYRLEITNSGTADAENVTVTILHGAGSEKAAPMSHRLGTLAAGQKKSLSLELTAHQDGNLSLQVEARGNDAVRAQLAQEIVVRRATLKVDVDAPKIVYSGNEVTYRIRVRNQGNASAENVKVRAAIPRGGKYVASPQNGRLSPDQGKVVWVLDRLNPGSEAMLPLVCEMSAGGPSQLDVQCVADGDLAVAASAVTQVETAANLVLSVDDPNGPIGLDGQATYHVRVQNRGTASAQDVEVVVYFANHMEPVAAEGGRHRLNSGQVVFESLPALAPGQTASFQVRAKADAAGNHVYRVEVSAKSTGDRLVREGTTRFYAADGAREPPSLAQPREPSAPSASESRTADRRDATPPEAESRAPTGFKR